MKSEVVFIGYKCGKCGGLSEVPVESCIFYGEDPVDDEGDSDGCFCYVDVSLTCPLCGAYDSVELRPAGD